jgi:hypothetical protein
MNPSGTTVAPRLIGCGDTAWNTATAIRASFVDIGSTASIGRGSEIIEIAPSECRNGHRLRLPNLQVCHGAPAEGDSLRCGYRCLTCDAIVWSAPALCASARVSAPLEHVVSLDRRSGYPL